MYDTEWENIRSRKGERKMKTLIGTKLVSKLMRKTAKECDMTQTFSTTDSWYIPELGLLKQLFPKTYWGEYRRIVRRYDVVTNDFLTSLEAKVKAEGFNIMDCNPKINMALGIGRKQVDNVDVYKDPGYIEQRKIAIKLYDKFARTYVERRTHLQAYDFDLFKLEPDGLEYVLGPIGIAFKKYWSPEDGGYKNVGWDYFRSKKYNEIKRAQEDLAKFWRKLEPKVSYKYEYAVEKSVVDSTTIGDTYFRLTARMEKSRTN